MKRRVSFLLLLCWSAYAGFAAGETITVGSVDEFLRALGSDRTIQLLPGKYDLSFDTTLGGAHFTYEGWRNNRSLRVQDLRNLEIIGAGARKTEVVVRPALGYVMKFQNCSGITIAQLRAGHGEEPGACTGGVLRFSQCQNIRLDHLELYGSGVEGLTLDSTREVLATHCTIEDCTQRILTAQQCAQLTFEGCTFRRNQDKGLVNITQTPMTTFVGCLFEENRAEGADFFELDATSRVHVQGGRFWTNTCDHLAKWEDNLSLKRVIFTDDNVFRKARFAYPVAKH